MYGLPDERGPVIASRVERTHLVTMDEVIPLTPAQAEFLSYTRITSGGCVRWKGRIDGEYGFVKSSLVAEWLPGNLVRGMPAHRVAYALFVGDIFPGYCIHHRCQRKWCVRADHLEQLTPDEHSRAHAALSRKGAKGVSVPEWQASVYGSKKR